MAKNIAFKIFFKLPLLLKELLNNDEVAMRVKIMENKGIVILL